jgi:hypothetical protein
MLVPVVTLLAMLLPAASVLAQSDQDIVVQRAGSQVPSIGAALNFTGAVRVEGRFQGSPPARISGGTVIFEHGARPPGTRTRSARRSSSRPASGWSSIGVAPSRRSAPATSSGSRQG